MKICVSIVGDVRIEGREKSVEAITRIQLLGIPRITVADQTVVLTSQPLAELIGYVALYAVSGRAVTRSKLAGTLFPDHTETHARRLLSETLYRLRRTLGDQADTVLLADEDSIALGSVWVDVHEFRASANSPNLAEWQTSIELYAGDLLEDLDVEWVLGLRANLHELYLAALERTCAACAGTGDLSAALQYAHRWTLADPLREEAHRAAMQLYVRLGRHAAALQQFNQFARLLADELQAEPLPETQALADSIRAELEAHNPLINRRLFVGRRAERAMLLERVEQVQMGRGGLILLEGQPGIGKTQLLEEAAEGAAWRGFKVVWGRAIQLGGSAPYAPLTDALQSMLVGPRVDRIRARLSPSASQMLAWLFPRAHGELTPPARLSAPLPEAEQSLDFTAALSECIQAIAALNAPLIFLDDVHWARVEFWSVMPALLRQTSHSRVLWLFSYRPDELRANPIAWETLRMLDRELAPLKIMLEGLSTMECAELAAALGYSLTAPATQQLYAHTGGNPLFVYETLTQDASNTTSFQSLLDVRLTLLPAKARAALEAGAVLGREFTHGRWQALVGADLLDAIPALLEARFIQESENGYRFQHDLTREYVYHAILSSRRRDLHRAAAETLIRELAKPNEIAWHFEQAEIWPETICYYYGAGDQAMNAYAYTSALEHYTHAVDLLPHLLHSEVARLALLGRRQRVLGMLLRMPEWRADVDEIERLAIELDDSATLLEGLEARLTIQMIDVDLAGMQGTASLAMTMARQSGNLPAEARIARTIGKHLHIQSGHAAQAIPYLQHAAELAEAMRDFPLLVSTLCPLAAAQTVIGQCAAAYANAARALAIVEQHHELHPLRPEALQQLAEVSLFLAEWESAHSTLRQVMQEQYALGKLWETGEAAYLFTVACAEMGQYAEALQTVEFVLGVAAQARINAERFDSILQLRTLAVYAHILAGHLPEAERALDALAAFRAPTAARTIVQGQLVWGLLRLFQGQPEAAALFLAHGVELSPPQLMVETVPGLLGHALAAHQINDLAAAQVSLSRAEQMLAGSDVARYNVLLHYARFQISGRVQDLQAAHDEIHRQAALFKDDRLRADFINQVYWHREVETHWQALQLKPAPLTIRLARIDAPLGKFLTEAERVDVQWTVDNGEEDAAFARHEGKAALRLHRLLRLIAESEAQGAIPTDADLARALGVAERTIERDLQTLHAKGAHIVTRRRQRSTHLAK